MENVIVRENLGKEYYLTTLVRFYVQPMANGARTVDEVPTEDGVNTQIFSGNLRGAIVL